MLDGLPGHPPSGLLLVDKPAGVTSFQLVNHVRHCLVRSDPRLKNKGRRGKGGRPPRFKCGHAGTLDPLATGLLVVLVGKGSRLSHFLLGLDKSYAATVRFGQETDSLDSDGQVVATSENIPAEPAVVEGALEDFRGEVQQIPPLISALKRDGQSLHKLVRAGKEVAPPEPRTVIFHDLQLLATRWPDPGGHHEADLLVRCSSGTYIRSLARDLATSLDTLGHLTGLRRLTVGPFSVDDALQDVMEADAPRLLAALRPLSEALPQSPRLVLDGERLRHVQQGGQPEADWLADLEFPPVEVGKSGRLFRLVAPGGRLVAVGKLDAESGDVPRLAAVIPGTEESDQSAADPTE